MAFCCSFCQLSIGCNAPDQLAKQDPDVASHLLVNLHCRVWTSQLECAYLSRNSSRRKFVLAVH